MGKSGVAFQLGAGCLLSRAAKRPQLISVARSRTIMSAAPGRQARQSAAALIIGDEILTGKIVDTNTNFIAKFLFNRGVDLRRVEVIPDDKEDIAASVSRLSSKFDYVFTSGGIGPTHDDLTYEAIASAYGLDLKVDKEVVDDMRRVQPDREINEAQLRMATLPTHCEKLPTEGLWVPLVVVNKNIYILPGVPVILQRMLNASATRFGNGTPRARMVVYTMMHEGALAHGVGEIAKAHPALSIGSYPKTQMTDRFNVKITVEGDVLSEVEKVALDITTVIDGVDDPEKLPERERKQNTK